MLCCPISACKIPKRARHTLGLLHYNVLFIILPGEVWCADSTISLLLSVPADFRHAWRTPFCFQDLSLEVALPPILSPPVILVSESGEGRDNLAN
jgi:hypothetical protein